ncbi:MAG: DsbA family oxidoreductase [Pseudomonadota bacterium]
MAISLEILSDPICPWCYIGKTRLERALEARPNHPLYPAFWRPFQLNPDMPKEGMDRDSYLEAKFGGKEGARQVYGRIEAAALQDGLEVRFDLIRKTPNTVDAHRVIRWAAAAGAAAQNTLVAALFKRYFEQGADLSDHDLLLDVAQEAGLERETIARLLRSETDARTVQGEDAAARAAGANGVPTFIVHGKFVVPGAQDTALWIRVIDELTESLAAPDGAAPPAAG